MFVYLRPWWRMGTCCSGDKSGTWLFQCFSRSSSAFYSQFLDCWLYIPTRKQPISLFSVWSLWHRWDEVITLNSYGQGVIFVNHTEQHSSHLNCWILGFSKNIWLRIELCAIYLNYHQWGVHSNYWESFFTSFSSLITDPVTKKTEFCYRWVWCGCFKAATQ